MVSNGIPSISLPDEAKAVIWRIFGAGESPLNSSSTYELIELVVGKRASSIDLNRVIREIRGWFESHGDRRWLKSEMGEPVAVMIVEGIRTERSETATFAIGSIEADLAARIIRARWCPKEIDSFVEAVLTTLENLCDQDEVLDVTRCSDFIAQDSIRAKIPKNTVEREGRLETFQYLDTHGFEFVYRGLHPTIGNLIELVVELRPGQFESLIERLDHPVVRTRAAHRMIAAVRPLDHCRTLLWIKKGSCDEMIALAIMHTLNTVNRLDEDIRSANRVDVDQHIWSTKLRPPQDDLDTAAANLLTGLIDRLATLDQLVCVRWTGELLSRAPYILYQHGSRDMPRRIEQLERVCTRLIARLVRQSWSDDLLVEFRSGLCLTSRTTWTRHMAEVAWEIRHEEPARATEIARMTLDIHKQQIADQLEQNHLFLDWSDWHQREWFSGLGVALVLSHEELDLPSWVSAQCSALPLSVWDAEENHEAFSTADRAVQHWFLVALHVIPALKELGRTVDAVAVCTLVKILWDHCHFVGRYLPGQVETSIVVEHAARFATEFGEPSDSWLLDQARHPGVGSRALWALIDQRRIKGTRKGRTDAHYDEILATELARVASDRFGGGGRFDLETLWFWGQLWLLLGAIDEAKQTAMAISAFPLKEHDRVYKILVLKLLLLVASKQKLVPTIEDYIASFYGQLWHGYTPSEERADRQQIDELLVRSGFPIP